MPNKTKNLHGLLGGTARAEFFHLIGDDIHKVKSILLKIQQRLISDDIYNQLFHCHERRKPNDTSCSSYRLDPIGFGVNSQFTPRLGNVGNNDLA